MIEISPKDFNAHTKENPNNTIIDVRTPAEFSGERIQNSINIPLSDKLADDVKENHTKEQVLYINCQSGSRAKTAAQALEDAGFQKIHLITGGINTFKTEKLPLENGGGKTISLERQVRITAGLIVFTGTILAYTTNPQFFIIPAFVGAGLTFAGITNTCAMGMLIAKMPWNQKA